MGAKHRMTEAPDRRQPPTDPRLSTACSTMVFGVASGAILCAATLATLMVNAVEPDKSSEATAVTVHGSPLSVSQEGMLIAVSPDSLTARSANGYVQTYRVNANTTVITDGGSQPATAASHFTVNDEVQIVGTIQGGTALATAVAERGMAHGEGPPMDYVESQPISGRAR
jgi:orotate phosphoribosyltransferase